MKGLLFSILFVFVICVAGCGNVDDFAEGSGNVYDDFHADDVPTVSAKININGATIGMDLSLPKINLKSGLNSIRETAEDYLHIWNEYCDEEIKRLAGDFHSGSSEKENSPPNQDENGSNDESVVEPADSDGITELDTVSGNDFNTAFDAAFKSRDNNPLCMVSLRRVVDGDTIIVDCGSDSAYIRLIGINTPESVHPDESRNTEDGKTASDYLKSFLKDTEILYLEFDESLYDKYDRVLAYVWLTNDTSDFHNLLNARIVEDGYAEIMTIAPNTKYCSVLSSFLPTNNL